MEAIQTAITQLTGAVNAQIEATRKIETRLLAIEARDAGPVTNQTALRSPRNESDLKEISKLPDSVKELQTFDGNPVQYISWIHNVENILGDYAVVKDKPIYRAILQSIRQKIRGGADTALISYNIFDEDWSAIKRCLSLHYADKRDIRTLEHQLNTLTQKNSSLDEFYANVNHQFSLIINKIKTEDYGTETIDALIENYRNRALDVFIRGLNGDLSKILIIQKPQTLPEAYASCLEVQNLNYRNLAIHQKNTQNTITAPVNQIFAPRQGQFRPIPPQPQKPMSLQHKNMAYNIQHNQYQKNHFQPQRFQTYQTPPRPTQQKPSQPMEVDQSIQTKQVNYMNKPNYNQQTYTPANYNNRFRNSSDNYQAKRQRLYNLETQDEAEYLEDYEEEDEEGNDQDCEIVQPEEESSEVNFMTKASLAYHT